MSRKLPPLLALRVFECAARHLSFTRAADELCVTQAAVSHQIRALEDWFGKPLFRRLSRSLKLTEAGERLLQPLTDAFDIMADVTTDVSADEGRQVLNVSMLDSFASVWVIPRLASFHQRFPDIDLRFLSRPLEEDVLGSGDADVEIRYGDGNWPGMHVYEFLKEELFPVCSPSLLDGVPPAEGLEDLQRFNLLHDVLSIGWEDFLAHHGVKSVSTRRGFGFNHSHLVMQACTEGNGMALGRSALVMPALRSGALVRPFSETMPADQAYYIVCRTADADAAPVKAFAYWLMDELESSGLGVIKAAA
ncbi:MAG: transcriptional regulator GcvA [Pseudomonadota bacterium]|uniref:transcriptional regulator GcvA n=1 Tax=Sphingomonas sp. ERG5 TaxID=1381597 RepID=UPI00054B3434|nr:transcriptional regulator GcvA [Sphingomonas sp. ERG5]